MIYIGYTDEQKREIIRQYQAEHSISHVVSVSPAPFELVHQEHDNITYDDVIMYVTFYRLLQEITNDTLIVINECLRTQNRYDLTYNCLRHYLAQTHHQLIFQQLPQIDERDDFMILFDLDTQSRWKGQKFDVNLVLDNAQVQIRPLSFQFNEIIIPTSDHTKATYEQERKRRFEKLGARDPHTLPRNLYLLGGKDKLAYIKRQGGQQLSLFAGTSGSRRYVARNKRLNHDSIVTYRDVMSSPETDLAIVEFPHRFIDFADFVKCTWQTEFDVLVADLRVDRWYLQRYQEWKERIDATTASLSE